MPIVVLRVRRRRLANNERLCMKSNAQDGREECERGSPASSACGLFAGCLVLRFVYDGTWLRNSKPMADATLHEQDAPP